MSYDEALTVVLLEAVRDAFVAALRAWADHHDALEARESALIDTLAEIEPIADTLVERIRILIQEAGYSA